MNTQIPVASEELVSLREVMRGFSRALARLEQGEVEKLVVINKNQMRAVIVSPEHYAELTAGRH
jgi:hypothetical protein